MVEINSQNRIANPHCLSKANSGEGEKRKGKPYSDVDLNILIFKRPVGVFNLVTGPSTRDGDYIQSRAKEQEGG